MACLSALGLLGYLCCIWSTREGRGGRERGEREKAEERGVSPHCGQRTGPPQRKALRPREWIKVPHRRPYLRMDLCRATSTRRLPVHLRNRPLQTQAPPISANLDSALSTVARQPFRKTMSSPSLAVTRTPMMSPLQLRRGRLESTEGSNVPSTPGGRGGVQTDTKRLQYNMQQYATCSLKAPGPAPESQPRLQPSSIPRAFC